MQCPRMSVWGLSTARNIRPVMLRRIHPELGVHAGHDHVESGQQLLVLVQRAVLQDVDLDPGQDAERGQLVVELGDDLELAAQALGSSPWATVSRGLWSVSAQ